MNVVNTYQEIAIDAVIGGDMNVYVGSKWRKYKYGFRGKMRQEKDFFFKKENFVLP